MRKIMPRFASIALLGLSAALGSSTAHAQMSAIGTGSQWNETEAGWQGVWQRAGRSDNWKATWTKGKSVVRADLTISVTGSKVQVERVDTYGPGVGKGMCAYIGTVRGTTVTGDYACPWSKTSLPWRATIVR